jgi:hypothetical protein
MKRMVKAGFVLAVAAASPWALRPAEAAGRPRASRRATRAPSSIRSFSTYVWINPSR